MNRRHHDRVDHADVEATISDGENSSSCVIRNLSHFGLLVEFLPTTNNHHVPFLFINVRAKDQYYVLRAIPLWSETIKEKKILGLRIFDGPTTWNVFIDSLGELPVKEA